MVRSPSGVTARSSARRGPGRRRPVSRRRRRRLDVVSKDAASASRFDLPTKAARAPRLATPTIVLAAERRRFEPPPPWRRRSRRPSLVDERHRALAHALGDQEIISVRAITSTMALPMPITSVRSVFIGIP